MAFFMNKKDKPTEDLKLSEFDSIWTKFCFLDETGSLASGKDPYFTLGILKMSQPYYLQSKILYERNKSHFYDELKFNKLSRKNIDFAKFVLRSVLETKSLSFYSYTTHKESDYFNKAFKGDSWIAYEKITLKLLDAALAESEIIVLIADHVTTPKDIRFEVNTKKQFNRSKGRLALAGVCRFDSKSNDLIQVVDLLIGCVTYDLKLLNKSTSGSAYKIELVNYFKELLGANSFNEGFRNYNFNIFVERQELEGKEKGLSS